MAPNPATEVQENGLRRIAQTNPGGAMLSNPVIDAIISAPQRVVARTSSVAGSRSQNRQAGEKPEGIPNTTERKTAIPTESTVVGLKVAPSFPKEDSFEKNSNTVAEQEGVGPAENTSSMPQPLTIVELRYLSTMSGSVRKSYEGSPNRTTLSLFA
jgi:hypothetical protein